MHKKNRGVRCPACSGRGALPIRGFATIEQVMPHIRGGYMCRTCLGTGRCPGKRRKLTGRRPESRMGIYLTKERRAQALVEYLRLGITYKVEWVDASGYGLHVVLEKGRNRNGD